VPRLVEKAHDHLLKVSAQTHLSEEIKANHIQPSLEYGRQIGNSYTASLYVALTSLLDTTTVDLSGKRIGFYSYGSGCVAEYFSGVVQPDYRNRLSARYHAELFAGRTELNYEEYAAFYQFNYVEDGSEQDIPLYNTGWFRLTKLANHKRVYEKVHPQLATDSSETMELDTQAVAQGMS
jgi:hydroxymethylglutaryl-CoA synthase